MTYTRFIGDVRTALGQNLKNTQLNYTAILRHGKMALAYIRKEELALVAQLFIQRAEHNRRLRPRFERNRIHGRNALFPVQQFHIPEPVEIVQPRLGVTLNIRPHPRQRIEAERHQKIILRQRPGAVEIAAGPAGSLGKTHFRSQHLDRIETILTRFRIQGDTIRIEHDQRAAHVGMVCSGKKNEFVRIRNRPGLIAGIDTHSVIAEQRHRSGTIRIRNPEPVKVRRRAVHIVPADIYNSPVMQHGRMPLACLMERQDTPVFQGRIEPVQGMSRQRFPRIVAASKAPAIRRHKRQAAVRQGTWVEVIVRAVGDLPDIAAVGVHGIDMETFALVRIIIRFLCGPPGKGEINRPGVIRKSQRSIIAPAGYIFCQMLILERIAGPLQQIDSSTGDVLVVIIVAKVLMQHLADKTLSLHKNHAFVRNQGILQDDTARHPADVMI